MKCVNIFHLKQARLCHAALPQSWYPKLKRLLVLKLTLVPKKGNSECSGWFTHIFYALTRRAKKCVLFRTQMKLPFHHSHPSTAEVLETWIKSKNPFQPFNVRALQPRKEGLSAPITAAHLSTIQRAINFTSQINDHFIIHLSWYMPLNSLFLISVFIFLP